MRERFFEALGEKGTRLLLLAISGILTAFTLVNSRLGILQWVTMIPLGLALISMASDVNIKLRRLYKYGLFFFMCF